MYIDDEFEITPLDLSGGPPRVHDLWLVSTRFTLINHIAENAAQSVPLSRLTP
jgi:hypothetical protein